MRNGKPKAFKRQTPMHVGMEEPGPISAAPPQSDAGRWVIGYAKESTACFSTEF